MATPFGFGAMDVGTGGIPAAFGRIKNSSGGPDVEAVAKAAVAVVAGTASATAESVEDLLARSTRHIPTYETLDKHLPWILTAVTFTMFVLIALQLVFIRRQLKRMQVGSLSSGTFADDDAIDPVGAAFNSAPGWSRGPRAVAAFAISVDGAKTARLNRTNPNPPYSELMTVTCPGSGTGTRTGAVRTRAAMCAYTRGWWLVLRSDGVAADALAARVMSGMVRYVVIAGAVMRIKHGNDIKVVRSGGGDGDGDGGTSTADFVVAVFPAQEARVTDRTLSDACVPIVATPWPASASGSGSGTANFEASLKSPAQAGAIAPLRYQIIAW